LKYHGYIFSATEIANDLARSTFFISREFKGNIVRGDLHKKACELIK